MISDNIFKINSGVGIGSKILGIVILVSILVYSLLCMFLPVSNSDNKEIFKYDDMNICIDSSCYQFGLTLLLSFVVFVVFYCFERSFPILGIIIIFILSIASIAVISTVNKLDTLFEYMKFSSIIVATLILSFVRISNITKLVKNDTVVSVVSWLLWLILAANIAEAVYSEIDSGHYINPIVGIILIILMPSPINTGKNWKDILFVDKGNYRDLVYKTSFLWVFLYIIWNLNYCYVDRTEHFSSILVVLFSALMTTMPNSVSVNPYLFIQARTFTLFMRYMILSYNDVFEKYSDSSGWYNKDAKEIWDYINLSIGIIYLVTYFYQNRSMFTKISSIETYLTNKK